MSSRISHQLIASCLSLVSWVTLAKDVLEFPIELEFKDESCIVKVSTIEGDIEIEGYEGDVILLKADGDFDEDRSRFAPKGWHVSQDGNSVDIHFGALSDLDHLSLKLPYKSNVAVSLVDGDISLRELSGEFEISSKDGDLEMTEMSGSVIANTVDGDVELSISEVVSDEFFISLNTLDGDIELELPVDIQANLSAMTFDGEIDIDDEFRRSVPKSSNFESGDGIKIPKAPKAPTPPFPPIRIRNIDNIRQIHLNGGGSIVELHTVDGDIEVRVY